MNNKAMHKLSYGLYIVTTKDGEKANGCIVNTAIQAASTAYASIRQIIPMIWC